MNFHHLLLFHKVAEKEHFTRAAEALFISQPAISKQIHELERTLGQPLFTQIGRRVYLTEAGRVLFEYTQRIFALSDEAESVLTEMHDMQRGRLAVGASTTIGTYLLPKLLGDYRKRYPSLELFLDIANASEVQERLLQNRIEIGLIEGSVTHDELVKRVWQQDELVLITANTSSLVAQDHLTLQDIYKEPFILREPGSGTRTVLEEAIATRGFPQLMPSMELGSTEAIKKVVAAGLGISFVSEHTITLESEAHLLRWIPLVDFTLSRPLYIVYPRQRRLSRAVSKFLELLEEAGRPQGSTPFK